MSLKDIKLLSKRGQHNCSTTEFLVAFFSASYQNKYDPITNPKGIINMGTASSMLMDKEIEERFSQPDMWKFTASEHQHYSDFHGKRSTRRAVANFFNTYFNVAKEISADNIILLAGSTACLDALGFALFDADDVFITPTPTYARIFSDFNEKASVHLCELRLPAESDSEGKTFSLSPELLEDKIEELLAQKMPVKGFVLLNPNNPLGDIYSPSLVRSLLEICAKYEIHAIIDEVYALSHYSPEKEGLSAFAIPDLPDPKRTHIVWSFSKDFCTPGLRFGVIHTWNEAVLKVLKNIAIYTSVPSIVQSACENMLNDTKWLELYFPRNQQRLSSSYEHTKKRLNEIGVPVRNSEAGLFVWFNLEAYLTSDTREAEMELFEEFYNAGVYLNPGTELYNHKPGWFRLVFTLPPDELNTGLDRIASVLKRKNFKAPLTNGVTCNAPLTNGVTCTAPDN